MDQIEQVRMSYQAMLDDQKQVIEQLKAQVEVATRGYQEAVQLAQWQAVTNRELNALTSENNRLRGALLLARWRLLLAAPEADTDDIDAALLPANASGKPTTTA